jgi:polar amino acid transport system substrate-binding protein
LIPLSVSLMFKRWHQGLKRSARQGGLAIGTSLMVLPAWAQQPASASVPGATMDARVLAPTGVLRASINVGNPILARRDPSPDGAAGVSVDMARELARRLGVPLQLQVSDSANASVKLVSAGEADIGFFALDPRRAQGVRFTQAYVQIEGSYLVRQDSPLRSNEEVDRSGVRVAVGLGSAYDLFLSRELRNAQLVRMPTSPQVVDMFLAQSLEVAAGVRQQLESDAQRLGGLRLLPGRFMVIEQAMAVPQAHGERAAALLDGFVGDLKRNGFVAQALQRHRIEGAAVAP